jgi:alkyl sulfatase BDS1-like metallo-beta-lactamase superfamily hydrolase
VKKLINNLVATKKNNSKFRSKRLIALLSILLAVMMVAPVVSQGFITASHVEFDTTYQGTKLQDTYIKMDITTQQEADKYPFTWWRDTTAQNALWSHSASQFPNQVVTAYEDANVKVLVWAGQSGANVIAIVGPTGNTIVGAGGSRNAAKLALHAFSDIVPNFQVNLRAIIFTEPNKEMIWGGQEWIGTNIERTAPVLIYAHSNSLEVGAVKQAISTATIQDELYTYGPEIQYGENGNLGVGSVFAYNPYQPDNGLVVPNRFIPTETTVSLGGVSVTLIPTAQEDAGLAVYLPAAKVLILGELFGRYFPPYGAITGVATNMPVTRWISVLDTMAKIQANVLVPMHTLPITSPTEVAKALGDSKTALISVHTQVIQKINAMMSEADIVATVKLPEPLASSPYTQEYVSTVECAVRAIYHYYLGWFNWETDNLNTLSEFQQAQFMVELAGGPSKALSTAKAYETDQTMLGVQKAIVLSGALRLAAPSHDADLIYIQALRKMAYFEESGQLRNFYLLTALRAEKAMN